MPVMRRVRHIRAMVGYRQQLNAISLRLLRVVSQRAVGVRAGNRVHMKVSGIPISLLS